VEQIFKLGEHSIIGISFTNINSISTYTLLITIIGIHLSIDFMKYGTRFGLAIGIKKPIFKITTGIALHI